MGQGGAGSNNGEIKIQAGAATGNDVVAFLNQAGTTRGNITYDTDHNFLMINVNQGEKLRVSSDGKFPYWVFSIISNSKPTIFQKMTKKTEKNMVIGTKRHILPPTKNTRVW